MAKHLFIFVLLGTLSWACTTAQEYTSKNKKAISAYQEGMKAMSSFNYSDAEESFKRALAFDPKFVEAYLMMGTMYEEQRMYEPAIEYFEKSLLIDPEFYPNTYYLVANLEIKTGQYEKALFNYETYLKRKNIKIAQKLIAEKGVNTCQFAIEQIKNPKDFNPKPLGKGVNSDNSEYMPALTADESTLIFTRLVKATSYETGSDKQEDFYISKFINGEWSTAVPLSDKLNSQLNEGAHTVAPDGKTLYFTGCNRESGVGSCDIYMSQWYKGDWDYPENLYEINSNSWDSQPSIAPDGTTLYFTSSRNGSLDLYVTRLDENNKWSEPEMLPKNINTTGNEMSPFMHPDGKTLYFVSDGHTGMGGLDIFYTRKTSDSSWSDPINIGYPINTHKDEAFLFVSASGENAYYAAGALDVLKNENSNMDIYSFRLYEDARPVPVTYLKGNVSDIITDLPLKASFELIDLKTGTITAASKADEKGAFLLCIPTGHDYMLNVSHENYLFHSENFSLSGVHTNTDPYVKNVQLRPISAGDSSIVILRNIFFDTDRYELKPESFAELDKLYLLMLKNPKLKIEIRGHTDNTGTKEINRVLSENRAKAVYLYLTNKGISADRMTYKGYGDSLPIDTNNTPEGRANNRRTEFKVISN